MADISAWSPVDESNTAAPPAGWPEGQSPASVNNCARAMMGAVRRWYDTTNAAIANLTTSLGNYLPLAGGTITGGLNVNQSLAVGVNLSVAGAASANVVTGNAVNSNGNMTAVGSIAAGTISGNVVVGNTVNSNGNMSVAGTLTAAQLTSTGNINATNDIHSGHDIWASAGTVTAQQLTSTIHINAGGTVTAAQLTSTGNINATSGTVFANIINGNAVNSNGDMSVGGSIGIGATVIATGNIQTNGNVLANTGHFTLDGLGGNTFGFYNSGASNVINFAPSYYFNHVIATGELTYTTPLGGMWFMRPGSAGKECWNNLGPTGGNGAYFNVSDRRRKENIEPWLSSLAELVQLNPVSFKRINKDGREVGFVAQDVECILPEAVLSFDMPTGDNNETTPTMAITDTTIVAALVNAVKELHTRLSQLEGKCD